MNYRVGSANERRGGTGLAHLLEHLMFRSGQSAESSRTAHPEVETPPTSAANAATGPDRTAYYQTLSSINLYAGLSMEANRLKAPHFTEAELSAERKVVLEEVRLKMDSRPFGQSRDIALANTYNCFSYAHPTIGAARDLEALTLQEIVEFRKAYYTPQRAVLTVVGDFSVSSIRKMITDLFESITEGPKVQEDGCIQTPQTTERRLVIPGRAARTARLDLVYGLPAVGTSDWYTALLTGAILADGPSSRFNQAIVVERNISAFVNWSTQPRLSHPIVEFSITHSNSLRVEDIEAIIDKVIADISAEPPSSEAVARTQKRLRLRRIFDLQTMSGRANILSQYEIFYGDAHLIDTFSSQLRSVTPVEISRVASKYLAKEKRTCVITLPQRESVGR